MQNVGVVVVSYHNENMTKKYITEELPKLETNYTLVVVNNASTREESCKLANVCGLTFVDNEMGGTFLMPKDTCFGLRKTWDMQEVII